MSTVPTPSSSILTAPRLVFLDALRVLAILLVIILHAMAPFWWIPNIWDIQGGTSACCKIPSTVRAFLCFL